MLQECRNDLAKENSKDKTESESSLTIARAPRRRTAPM